MTAAQKKARDNFKKAIAYRKKTGCTLKQAFAHIKGSTVKGLDKVVKKGNKTAVIYSKKTAAKKKYVAKNKVVKQGSLFGVKNKNFAKKDFDIVENKIMIFEKELINHKKAIANKNLSPTIILQLKKQLISIKKYLVELKTHKTELKKLI